MLKYWHDLFRWLRYWHHLSIPAEVAFLFFPPPPGCHLVLLILSLSLSLHLTRSSFALFSSADLLQFRHLPLHFLEMSSHLLGIFRRKDLHFPRVDDDLFSLLCGAEKGLDLRLVSPWSAVRAITAGQSKIKTLLRAAEEREQIVITRGKWRSFLRKIPRR